MLFHLYNTYLFMREVLDLITLNLRFVLSLRSDLFV